MTAVGWLAGSVLVVATAAGQVPETSGVVVARAAGDAEADGRAAAPTGLGFVVGERRIIASVAPEIDRFVVTTIDGDVDHDAGLVSYDPALGLGLLDVPALTAPPYAFARDPVAVGEALHGGARDNATGVVTFVRGSVREVRGGTATDPGVIRHDAYSPEDRSAGAPLLNGCGQLVGAVVRTPNPVSPGAGRAVPGAWLRDRFGDEMSATTVETPCPPAPGPPAVPPDPPVPAPETPLPPGPAPSSAADSTPAPEPQPPEPLPSASEPLAAEDAPGLSQDERRLIELGLDAAGHEPGAVDGWFDSRTQDAIREWQTAGGEEPTGYLDGPARMALLLLGRQQEALAGAERQGRYVRWTAVAAMGATAVLLLLWVVGRRSAAKELAQVGTRTLAWAAQPDAINRGAPDRPAGAAPAVHLDGPVADGGPLALRIPGGAIGGAGGAVVGRSPFDSTVVLDHVEVSRRHFRLVAAGTSVLIEDLDSMNGTKLNGVALAPGHSAPLPSGAVLHVGSLEFTVTLQT